jgi:hypothetical protein
MQVSLETGENNDSSLPLLPSSTSTSDINIHNSDSYTDPPRLPLALRLLYGLNGVTLSLPITALLYIVNTRASIPLEYLSAYGAIAFLPWSLKPLYAYLSGGRNGNVLLVLLLVTSGVSTAATALIPHGSISLCFLFGFVRGVTSAWPEFLVGLALVQHARLVPGKFESVAAHLQSEAATARNFGSTVAALCGFLLFIIVNNKLNDTTMTLLLVATGILNLIAAMIAFLFQVGSKKNTTCTTTTTRCLDLGEDDSSYVHTNVQTNSYFGRRNCVFIVIFQLAIIVLSMQGPISNITSNTFWILVVVLLLAILLSLIRKWPISSHDSSHLSVGLFLILRHAIPTCDYLMDSFFYSKLKSKPILLQTLAIVNMGVTTLSSWSYGKILAKGGSGANQCSLVFVILFTTIVSSCAVLGNLVLVAHYHSHENDITFFMLVVTIGSITAFAEEWQFLPDVVLATAASMGVHNNNDDNNDDDNDPPILLVEEEDSSTDSAERESPNITLSDSTGMLYGTLISCIDFGDQIGSWVTVPLVTMLGISRDNDWANLNIMIILTSVFELASILLLKILKQ